MQPFFHTLLDYLLRVGLTTLTQLFILFGPGLILALVMYGVSRFVQDRAIDVLGWKGFVYGLKILGTPVHELGHALFALIFGHRIIEFQPFKPDPYSGTLGYVVHAYNERNIYHQIGNFFIGVGPVIVCSLVVYYSTLLLLGSQVLEPLRALQVDIGSFQSLARFGDLLNAGLPAFGQVFAGIFNAQNLADWKFYIFLYIAISVGTSIVLSPLDIKGAWTGMLTLILVVFVFNLVTLWLGDFATRSVTWVSRSFGAFYAILIFTLMINLGLGLLLVVPYSLKRRFQAG